MATYDLVIYGATGFTGQFVVEEVARVAEMEKARGVSTKALTWAVAGRNKDKLKLSLDTARKETGFNFDQVGIIEANNDDQQTISDMVSQAKVVINCVGPYQHYGEPVIQACIKNKTNHVDISGEPQFLDKMRLLYDKSAEEAGIHIVGACGYDSVPADMGVSHMMKKFPGTLNSAECFVRFNGGRDSSIHTGTMESAALAIANRGQLEEIRQKLYPTKLPKPKFRKEKRGLIHKNTETSKPFWALPLPSDEPQVYSTQRYLYENEGLRPIQFQGFLSLPTFMQSFGTLIGALYFITMCYFSWTRSLILKYPEICTAGVFTRKGSSKDQLKSMSFTSTIVGKGWANKLADPKDEYSTPPDSKIIVKITGPDPGYGATSLMLVASAMTILREKSDCKKKGGVMSPGTAFMDTKLMNRLQDRGMKVEVELPEIQ